MADPAPSYSSGIFWNGYRPGSLQEDCGEINTRRGLDLLIHDSENSRGKPRVRRQLAAQQRTSEDMNRPRATPWRQIQMQRKRSLHRRTKERAFSRLGLGTQMGSVANTKLRTECTIDLPVLLRSDTKDLMNETNLAAYITFACQLTCPSLIMCMDSYPAMVFTPRLVVRPPDGYNHDGTSGPVFRPRSFLQILGAGSSQNSCS
jgi:hypothetical protein